jgi:TetR/AcrR family transcriptional regulator
VSAKSGQLQFIVASAGLARAVAFLVAVAQALESRYITDHSVSIVLHMPTTTRQRRKEARPQELLDAALALFGEKGFAATRSEEVAARAGVSKGTLYLYYPSKEDLLKAVIRENLSNLIAEGADTLESHEGSTGDLLKYLVGTWWERVGNTPASAIHKIMLSEVRNFPEIAEFYMREVMGPAQALFARTIQRGIDRGEFRAVPLKEMTVVMFAPMMFLCLHKHSLGACNLQSEPPDPATVLATHIDVVLTGLLCAEPKTKVKEPKDAVSTRAKPKGKKPV